MTTLLLNLKTEIARNKLSAARIAKKIGISENAMSRKILEKTDFTRTEMYAIASLFPGVAWSICLRQTEIIR